MASTETAQRQRFDQSDYIRSLSYWFITPATNNHFGGRWGAQQNKPFLRSPSRQEEKLPTVKSTRKLFQSLTGRYPSFVPFNMRLSKTSENIVALYWQGYGLVTKRVGRDLASTILSFKGKLNNAYLLIRKHLCSEVVILFLIRLPN